ncbi:monoamine oxidase [Pilimelia terevasa]|uniref:Monoamine oxidase n=2 Tax=Pilimelia terevasa TaxID=53372 RepID=A0A8J3FHR8_9ACTN|nr:monoamine oxidase [Pilimelia terevasa]
MGTRRAQVAVVGAGLSGLAAARVLARAGRDVVVWEARPRVGGRVWSLPTAHGVPVDAGAEFVGPTQDRIRALVAECGLALAPTYDRGHHLYQRAGRRRRYRAGGRFGPIPPDPGVAEVALLVGAVNRLARAVPAGAPWRHPRAAEFDALTAQQWLGRRAFTPGAHFLSRLSLSSALSVPADEVSFLFWLHYVAGAGNATTPGTVQRLASTGGGAQESLVVGGAQEVAVRLAAALGDRVRLGTPVRALTQDAEGVTLAADDAALRAERVIVAMAPALTASIAFRPTLPAARLQLAQRMPMGAVGKVVAVYPTPFWRDSGLSGQALTDGGPVDVTFDSTPPGSARGVLTGFVSGAAMRRLDGVPADAVREACLPGLARLFGPAAGRPLEFLVQRWDREEWSRGGPTGVAGCGTLTAFGPALHAPCDRIHWAGTETAEYWAGYMDGAVRAGERAAREVMAALD